MSNNTFRVTRTTAVGLAAVAALGLSLTACSGDNGSTVTPATVTVTQGADATASTSASGSAAATATDSASGSTSQGSVDATAAITTALDHVVDAFVVEVDDEDGRYWEVTVATADGQGIEVTIDQSSGDVLSERNVTLDSWQKDAPSVTAEDAVSAALAAQSGQLESLDLDREGGQVVWEVKVVDGGDEWDLWIDPSTGEVLRSERDD
ncbi:PepSY domain-containing protein [Corynebacterium terpenotabidum]|uniref:PepSY domain-containing protein n=1 Tax=Corynebacterium terpenotabidum Y-11 TaxID=1200352 RepID=S4XF75_9CORY|nr:PepSY domain-containing protein [Corynebacterium terpenotabidum]AGP30270.1 hypothetical protein A606_03085 [Corynebacterium terpenotabidum Y-11]